MGLEADARANIVNAHKSKGRDAQSTYEAAAITAGLIYVAREITELRQVIASKDDGAVIASALVPEPKKPPFFLLLKFRLKRLRRKLRGRWEA